MSTIVGGDPFGWYCGVSRDAAADVLGIAAPGGGGGVA
jgi:hypothetical protein